VTTYRERLSAPVSWWIAALAFAVVWGWVFVVATTWTFGIIVTVVLFAICGYAVWRYGSVPEGLRVGRAFVDPSHVGAAAALDRAAYRRRLGTEADARAYLLTRPYLDHGVVVTIDDPADPTPYWLISSRHPDALASALQTSSPTAPHDMNGDAPRGEEA
jgi:hypothetical protein